MRLFFCFILSFIFSANLAQDKKAFQIYDQLNVNYDSGYLENTIAMEKQINGLENVEDSLAADLYYYLADAFLADYNLEKAKIYLERELSYRQQLTPLVQKEYSDNLYNLVYVLQELGQLDAALTKAQKLLEADEQIYGEKSEEYLGSFTWYIDILRQDTQYEKALKEVEKKLKKLNSDSYEYAVLASRKGDLLLLLGNYNEAEQILFKAADLFRKVNAPFDAAVTEGIIGMVYMEQGRYPEAEVMFLEMEEALKAIETEEADFQLDNLYNNLAQVYRVLARYEEAIDLYNKILVHDASNFGKVHANYLTTLNNKGVTFNNMERYDSAEQVFEKSLVINADVYGQESLMFASLKTNLADIYRLTGRIEAAIKNFKVAEETYKEVFDSKENTYVATVKFNLGKTYLAKRDKQALKHLQDALKMRKKLLGEEHPKYGKVTNYLGLYYWQQNDVKKANEYFNETFKNYFEQIRLFFSVLSEEEKTKFYYGKLKPSFEQYASFAEASYASNPAILGDLYNYQLETKGLIMYATEKVRSTIYNEGDSSLINKYESWRTLKERISKLYSGSSPEQQQLLDTLVDKSNTLERELVQASSAFADTYEDKSYTWQAVRDKLEPGQAAMEVIRYKVFDPNHVNEFSDEIHYMALIVTSETRNHPKPVIISNGAELEAKYLNNYRNAIRFQVEEAYSYEQFWKPFEEKLGDVDVLYFSPDGVYNQINVNTLENPATGQYLIKEMRIKQLTNTKELIAEANESSSVEGGTSYLFGFPTYTKNGGGTSGEVRGAMRGNTRALRGGTRGGLSRGLRGGLMRYLRSGEGIAPLPGTKAEVEGIANLYEDKNQSHQVVLENQASEATLKSIDNPEILHIATHGFFLENANDAEIEVSEKYYENPLLRSGIVLAGAEDYLVEGELLEGGQDGVLTAYEAMNLNLNATDLVVLSACETGLGTVQNGEGVYGLQRAFRLAGAKSVIMSMWNVDDDATQELMTLFYNNWTSGMSRYEAFYDAQLKLKDKYPAPFYWGAFVIVGL